MVKYLFFLTLGCLPENNKNLFSTQNDSSPQIHSSTNQSLEYIFYPSTLISFVDDILANLTFNPIYIDPLRGHFEYLIHNPFNIDEIAFFLQSTIAYLPTPSKIAFISLYGFPESLYNNLDPLIYTKFLPFFKKDEFTFSEKNLSLYSSHFSVKYVSQTDLPTLKNTLDSKKIVSLFFTYEKDPSLESFFVGLVSKDSSKNITFLSSYPVRILKNREIYLVNFAIKALENPTDIFLYSGIGSDLLSCLDKENPLNCLQQKDSNLENNLQYYSLQNYQ